jgi:hypothetical protein
LVALLTAFVVLMQVADYSLPATALLSLLVFPGVMLQTVVTGNPHSVGAFVMVSAFVIDYALGLAALATVRQRNGKG